MRYHNVKDGEWIQPRRKNYYMKCCDCGLVHALDFRLIKDSIGRAFIQFKARRINKRVSSAVSKVRKNPKNSKAFKVANNRALTQRI